MNLMSRGWWRVVRVGALLSAVAIVAITVRWLRSPQAPPRVAAVTATDSPQASAAIAFDEVSASFQGPLQRKDKDEGWVVFTMHATDTANDPIRFRYTVNVITVGKKDLIRRGDDGELSIARATVRFGEFRGRVRRDARGRVVLQSNPIDGPPYWYLEPVVSPPAATTAE